VHTHFAPASVLAAARRGQGFDGMIAGRNAATLFGLGLPG